MPQSLKRPWSGVAALALLLALVGVFSLPAPASALFGMFSDTKTLSPQGDAVTIPLADVSDGKAHFYVVSAGGKEIKFFAVKSADGKVRTAFDACDVCFHEKKGYTQDKEFMICNNCGMRFHSSRIGDV